VLQTWEENEIVSSLLFSPLVFTRGELSELRAFMYRF